MATWLITGCSTGLGHELAKAVLAAGHNAVITARNLDTLSDLVDAYPTTALALQLDVRDSDQINAVADTAERQFGTIDVLVNNAGHGYRAAVEEGEVGEVMELFESNFFGAATLIKRVLPGMRQRRSGTILNVTSIAAQFSNPGSGYYSASKAALEGLSEALRKEVAPLGIRVTIIEPGAFRTDFAGRSLHQSQVAIDDYADTAGRRRKEHDDTHGTQPGDPVRAAEAILTIAEADDPPLRLLLGSDALDVIGVELRHRLQAMATWEALSRSTDFPD